MYLCRIQVGAIAAMGKMRFTFLVTLLLFTSSNVRAEFKYWGDADVRPRRDIVTYDDTARIDVNNTYVLYRTRLSLRADIGNGWYYHTKLGHRGASYWLGRFGTGELPDSLSIASAGRASVDFLEMYIALDRGSFGGSAGLIPIDGRKNPVFDLHYYPDSPVEFPWYRYNQNGAHGFSGWGQIGPGRMGLTLLIDDESGQKLDGDQVGKDRTSIMLDMTMDLYGMSFQPLLINSSAADSLEAPISYGFNLELPTFAGLQTSTSAFWTSQTEEDTLTGAEAYEGLLVRAKLMGRIGPGHFVFWHDWAQVDSGKYRFLWASYRIPLHRSEDGDVAIMPIYRLTTKLGDYSRAKIELGLNIRFK